MVIDIQTLVIEAKLHIFTQETTHRNCNQSAMNVLKVELKTVWINL